MPKFEIHEPVNMQLMRTVCPLLIEKVHLELRQVSRTDKFFSQSQGQSENVSLIILADA